MSFLIIVNIVKSLLIVLCLGEIDTRKETLERHLTRGNGKTLYGGCRARLLCREEGTVDVNYASEMDRLWRWLEASAWQ